VQIAQGFQLFSERLITELGKSLLFIGFRNPPYNWSIPAEATEGFGPANLPSAIGTCSSSKSHWRISPGVKPWMPPGFGQLPHADSPVAHLPNDPQQAGSPILHPGSLTETGGLLLIGFGHGRFH